MRPPPTARPVLLPHFRITEAAVETLGGRRIETRPGDTAILAFCNGCRTLDEIGVASGQARGAIETAIWRLLAERLIALVPDRPAARAAQPVCHVVIAPHVDDAALSLGGTILNLSAGGETVNVTIACSRQSYQTGLRVPPERIDDVALAEERLACAMLGASVSPLGFWGARDRYPQLLRRTLGASPGRIDADPALAGDLARIERALAKHLGHMRLAEDGRLTVYAPCGIGGHVDHVLVREAVCNLSRNALPPHRLVFYEDLPYAADPTMGADMPEPHPGRWSAALEDIGEVLERKLAALRVYRTRLRAPQIELCRRHALRLAGARGAAERNYRPGQSEFGDRHVPGPGSMAAGAPT